MTAVKGMPSAIWYVLAAILFIVCALGSPVLFVVLLIGSGAGQQFQVPGSTTLDVPKAGTYVLWYDHSTFFAGRAYHSAEALPDGLEVRIVDPKSGREIPMATSRGWSETSGSEKRSSVGEFEAALPGPYRIEVSGSFEPRIFSIRRSLMVRMLFWILALIGAELLGWIGAPTLAILVFLRRRSAGAAA